MIHRAIITIHFHLLHLFQAEKRAIMPSPSPNSLNLPRPLLLGHASGFSERYTRILGSSPPKHKSHSYSKYGACASSEVPRRKASFSEDLRVSYRSVSFGEWGIYAGTGRGS